MLKSGKVETKRLKIEKPVKCERRIEWLGQRGEGSLEKE